MKCKWEDCENEARAKSPFCGDTCYKRHRRDSKPSEDGPGSTNSDKVVLGYVYLIHCVGFPFYKIGVTTRTPQSRLRALQTGLPFDLELEFAIQVPDIYREEAELHEAYKDNHVRGEWFCLNQTELEYLKGELVTIRHGYVWEPLP